MKKVINNMKEIVYNYDLLKETDINKIYEESLYQLCLRLNYDIYMSDIANNIEGIVFWYNNEPKAKIKRTDFGFKWNSK